MGRVYIAVAVAALLLVAGLGTSPAYAGCGGCDKCDKPACGDCHDKCGCQDKNPCDKGCDKKCCTMNSASYYSIQELVAGERGHKPISADCCQRNCFELLCCERGEFELLCPKPKPCKEEKCSSCKPKCKQDTCSTCKPKCKQDTCTTCKPKCKPDCQKECCKPKCKPDCAKPCCKKDKCVKCKQDTCTTCKPKCSGGCGRHGH